MISIVIDVFRDFNCIADACPNTCCAGWDIRIDDKTYQKMEEHEQTLGIPAKDWISSKNGCFYARLGENYRCPMLDDKNPCGFPVMTHLRSF